MSRKMTKEDITSEKLSINIRTVRPFKDISGTKDVLEMLRILTDWKGYYHSYLTGSFYKNGNIHCYEDKLRSLGDIVRMIRYYHPDITIETIFENLLKINNNHVGNIRYCGDIRKIRFNYMKGYNRDNISDHTDYLVSNICKECRRDAKNIDFIDFRLIIKHLLKKHINTDVINDDNIKQLLTKLNDNE